MLSDKYVRELFSKISLALRIINHGESALVKIGEELSTPYRILVSTIIIILCAAQISLKKQ